MWNASPLLPLKRTGELLWLNKTRKLEPAAAFAVACYVSRHRRSAPGRYLSLHRLPQGHRVDFLCVCCLATGSIRNDGFHWYVRGQKFLSDLRGRVASLRVDEVEVMIGTLDQVPTDLTPEYELWTGRRENWLNPLKSATQFEKDAEPLGNDSQVEPSEQPECEASTEGKPPVRRLPKVQP